MFTYYKLYKHCDILENIVSFCTIQINQAIRVSYYFITEAMLEFESIIRLRLRLRAHVHVVRVVSTSPTFCVIV